MPGEEVEVEAERRKRKGPNKTTRVEQQICYNCDQYGHMSRCPEEPKKQASRP
jgi:hypothetical protein